MGDLKNRITTLLRRGSATSSRTLGSAKSATSSGDRTHLLPSEPNRRSSSLKLQDVSSSPVDVDHDDHHHRTVEHSGELYEKTHPSPVSEVSASRQSGSVKSKDRTILENSITEEPPLADATPRNPIPPGQPAVTLEEPTPIHVPAHPEHLTKTQLQLDDSYPELQGSDVATPLRSHAPKGPRPQSSHPLGPPDIVRRQSLVATSNARIIKTLLDTEHQPESAGLALGPASQDYFTSGNNTFSASMLHRKIWVKRPSASATLVQIREDDLVDDVRETILKKYGNSLGRAFDAPDIALRIFPRDTNQKAGDRVLGPEEEMCRTLDAYYPGGQNVNEALIIDVPHKRTPRPSPRAVQQGVPYYYEQSNPVENAAEYFPPMPLLNPSPAAMTSISHDSRSSMPHAPQQHSIAILNTGQLPSLPSPGSTRRSHHSLRPQHPRQHTSSQTTLANSTTSLNATARPNNRPHHDSTASDNKHPVVATAPIPTPPAAEGAPAIKQGSSPPIPRVSSPRPKTRKKQKAQPDTPSLPASLLDGSVPPINVLIVEDNIINLRVLGAFMERLKVRWQRAMNGREAVTKWRAGGFHLVLMDIQLPIMNGLEATKEIRRLERVNSIGVFSSGSNEAPKLEGNDIPEADKLGDGLLFKSPVIIVALTASSLQSDRHEALAAGCNDFLTKVIPPIIPIYLV
jgi:osomolarity two-component system response regulator SSK1